jgi:hypothetical protein
MEFGLALALCGFISAPVHACTIFVLTDTNRALFCNNEDWSNPKTRIWFTWKEVSTNRKLSQATIPVWRREQENIVLLQKFIFDEQNKVAWCRTEDIR